jgi:hypothetical protein
LEPIQPDLCKALFKKLDGAIGSVDISRPQFPL